MSVVVKRPARPGSPATDILVDLAVRALVEEVRLTPSGAGDCGFPARTTIILALMLRSAESLRTTFADHGSRLRGGAVEPGVCAKFRGHRQGR